jgi:hypothetical protein
MSTITITDEVTYADGSITPVSVEVHKDGCTVTFHETTTDLSWGQLDDVEQLSEVFADCTVRSFKVIIPLVAKALKLKEAL